MTAYLDTSAAMKVLVKEAESVALVRYLASLSEPLVASWMLSAELHCAANRHPDVVDADAIAGVLDSVVLIDVTRGDLLTAGGTPGRLRTNDAINLVAALRVGADRIVTYDAELAAAAATVGLEVVAPS